MVQMRVCGQEARPVALTGEALIPHLGTNHPSRFPNDPTIRFDRSCPAASSPKQRAQHGVHGGAANNAVPRRSFHDGTRMETRSRSRSRRARGSRSRRARGVTITTSTRATIMASMSHVGPYPQAVANFRAEKDEYFRSAHDQSHHRTTRGTTFVGPPVLRRR